MKSVIKSAKPYWIYLILTGKKTVEVSKNFPKFKYWNKIVEMYCSKDMRSFNRIPEKDREWMRKYLGKIACRFVCDEIATLKSDDDWNAEPPQKVYVFDKMPSNYVLLDFDTCLTNRELLSYGKGKPLYGWHISDLVIYDTPRELGEFWVRSNHPDCDQCAHVPVGMHPQEFVWHNDFCGECHRLSYKSMWATHFRKKLTRPPQSWCYVREV